MDYGGVHQWVAKIIEQTYREKQIQHKKSKKTSFTLDLLNNIFFASICFLKNFSIEV